MDASFEGSHWIYVRGMAVFILSSATKDEASDDEAMKPLCMNHVGASQPWGPSQVSMTAVRE